MADRLEGRAESSNRRLDKLEEADIPIPAASIIACREQLWLFRGTHLQRADSLGEKVTRYEFAEKFPVDEK